MDGLPLIGLIHGRSQRAAPKDKSGLSLTSIQDMYTTVHQAHL